MREANIEIAVMRLLQMRGFKVHKTSRVRRCCPKCKHVDTRPEAGITVGISDLLVRRSGWTPGMWLAVEVKGPGTKVSPAQREQLNAGELVMIRGEVSGHVTIRSAFVTPEVQELVDALEEIVKAPKET